MVYLRARSPVSCGFHPRRRRIATCTRLKGATWRLPLHCQTSPWTAMQPSCRGLYEASLSHELSHGWRWQVSDLQVCLRLKIGRSAVRPRPWPPPSPQVRPPLTCGFVCPGQPAMFVDRDRD